MILDTVNAGRRTNNPDEVKQFLLDVLGEKGVAAIDKQLTIERPSIDSFSDYKGYEKALKQAEKAVKEASTGPVFVCPAATGKNPDTHSTWQDLSDSVYHWGSDYKENTYQTIAYMLGEANRRRRSTATTEVYAGIERRADALDAQAKVILENVLTVLRHVRVLKREKAYAKDDARLLRHLTKAREDIMDCYLPFFASVQGTINRVDAGNAKFSEAVEALRSFKLEDILKKIQGLCIHGCDASLEIPKANLHDVANPLYVKAIATHEGIKFLDVLKVDAERQDRDGYATGIETTDVTEQSLAILSTLLKGE
jgi:hypothetical protein